MTAARTRGRAGRSAPDYLWLIGILAAVSWCVYWTIATYSRQFGFDTPGARRPLLAVLGLLALAFACYLAAIWLAARSARSPGLLGLILIASAVFRITLLGSTPIQEIDIYRYVWDGAASCVGVSPFRYSPEQVRAASSGQSMPADLARLAALRDSSPALATILGHIHYAHLPTVYPPVSQIVFAAATLTTPARASVATRLLVMKTWLVAFDLATLLLVVALLKLTEQPPALCVIYGWCPLLLKEVANSGHLDTIAIFLCTLAVYLTARILFRADKPARGGMPTRQRAFGTAILSIVILALAVGAKLYPAVLAPLLLAGWGKRLGWLRAAVLGVVWAAVVLLMLWPMLPIGEKDVAVRQPSSPVAMDDPPALPSSEAAPARHDPSLGLVTFLGRWEMNDFFFLLLVENLKPTTKLPPNQIAWFSFVPDSLREALIGPVCKHLQVEPARAAFFVSRGITLLIFLALAAWLACRKGTTANSHQWLGAAFLTLGWFWLLCPTQNPWYWMWALPLLPFARGRAWLAMSGLVLMYYLRFWLGYHWTKTPLLGTPYFGREFFDFIVTWLEFAPWLIWLSIESCFRGRSRIASTGPTGNEE